MSISVLSTGSTLMDGTEQTIATISANGIIVAEANLSALVSGDIVVFRVKTRILTAGATRTYVIGTFTGAQAQPVKMSIPCDSPFECIVTLQQTAGTFRTIPWRVESLGATTIENSGTQLAVIGNEQTLHTETDVRNASLVADLAALAAGDTLELRMKTKVTSGGVSGEDILATYSGVQSEPIVQSIPVTSPYELICTLKQTAGVARSFPWRVDSFG